MNQMNTRNKRTRYPGISEHARTLGVSRPHLWMVLQGQRQSRRLMECYRKLTAGRK